MHFLYNAKFNANEGNQSTEVKSYPHIIFVYDNLDVEIDMILLLNLHISVHSYPKQGEVIINSSKLSKAIKDFQSYLKLPKAT